ncbi:MAG: LamG-like jellyroll fold domain-containing protein [Phycisphaerales bacterium]
MCKRLVHAMALIVILSLAGGAWADLAGHWKLDEGAGAVAADSSGNGHDGALLGNPQWVAGMYGGALQFAGTSNKVDIPYSDQLNPADQFSLSLWANADPAGSGHRSPITSRDDAPTRGYIIYVEPGNTWQFWNGTGVGTGTWNTVQGPAVDLGEWTHVAATFSDGNKKFYINGELVGEGTSAFGPNTQQVLRIGGGASEGAGNYFFVGKIDDVAVFDHALTQSEVKAAMAGVGPAGAATNPNPEDASIDVPRDTALGWEAGKFAATHDVYIGTSFSDVNDAGASDPRGVLLSQGQTDATYAPADNLEYGRTYYWRIDEVNGAPDYTVFQGSVWSFTVETYGYPITNVTAEASAAQITSPAIRTIDGSGLDALDQHGVDLKTMWVTPGGLPAWIQYTFDKEYKLHELWVWNANSELELLMGFGAKDVAIEYSTDGETWTPLENVPQFSQGTGTATYTPNVIVSLGGVMAKHVKLTIHDNWGATTMTSLSEVRFFHAPVRAFSPQPAVGAAGVSIETDLTWRSGREAASHVVYIDADSNAVADGAVPGQTTTDRVYTPPGLMLGTKYFWKVDEVGDTGTYAGDIWDFTTEDYLVVDDFESYDDDIDAETTIWHTWIDGVTDKASGSQVGYTDAPFAERTNVHGGKQSMPLQYNNTDFSFSEAKRTFDSPQDWTAHGVKSLSLHFAGMAGNRGQLYVKINNTRVVYDSLATDLAETTWLPWNIDLSTVGNVSGVRSLTIGVEGSGTTGTLYIDDIRLYSRTPEYIVPTEPDTAGLVAHYTFDGNLNDSAGSHHGTALGNAKVASDPTRGQVLSLDGSGDAVDIPYSADLNPEAFTASFWAYPDPAGTGHRSPLTSRNGTPLSGYLFYIEPGNAWQFWTGNGAAWDPTTGPAAKLGEWTHVAATFGNEQRKLYINGRLAGQGTAPLSLNTQRPLRIGGGATEGTGDFFFPGMIDEVLLFNRVLSAAEVAGLAGQTTPLHASF